MALMKCKECGGEVSTSASACPKCGAPVVVAPGAAKRIAKGVGYAFGALIALSVIGAFASKKPSTPTGSSTLPVAPAPEQTEQATQVALPTLLAEYKGNELRADGMFKDKLIVTTGVVGDVKKDILDDPYVTVGSGAAFEIPVLQCSLAKDQAGAASQLSKGQRVTISGRVSGLMMNVLAKDCRIQ